MIATTEAFDRAMRKLLAALAQADEAMVELRVMLEAAHDSEKAITREMHAILDKARVEAMKGE